MNIIATKGHLPFCMTYIYLQNKRHIFMDKQLTETSRDIKDNLKDIQKELIFLKKIEKLTSAIYKITDLMPQEEPLKWKIRKDSLSLLSSAMSFINHWKETSSQELSVILHNIARLISFLEVSYMGSFVSQMNFRVLKEEYDALHNSIRAYKNDKEVSSNLIVTREELEGVEQFHKDEKDKRTLIKDTSETFDNGHYAGKIFKVDHLRLPKSVYNQKTYTAQKRNIRNNGLRTGTSHGTRNLEEKTNRRSIIMSFIKSKGKDVNIKDIFELPELSKSYSEKTIQRELVDMVNQGTIKKHGERRWSRYSA